MAMAATGPRTSSYSTKGFEAGVGGEVVRGRGPGRRRVATVLDVEGSSGCWGAAEEREKPRLEKEVPVDGEKPGRCWARLAPRSPHWPGGWGRAAVEEACRRAREKEREELPRREQGQRERKIMPQNRDVETRFHGNTGWDSPAHRNPPQLTEGWVLRSFSWEATVGLGCFP